MDLGLQGKVAWVLGASSGLGRACATSLAREGGRVAISARGERRLKEAADDIRGETNAECVAHPLDVTDADAIAAVHSRIVDELGPVDILVANGGGPPPGTFAEMDDAELYEAFALIAASAWRLAKAVVPAMRARKRGCILFVTSSSTKEVLPNLLLSNMMRVSVVGMAKTLSKELAADGIRVCCVAPGRIETPRVLALDEETVRRSGKSPEDVRAESEARIPLGRYGKPEEFGDVVAFLASDRASYVTGTSVLVDGGKLDGVLS